MDENEQICGPWDEATGAGGSKNPLKENAGFGSNTGNRNPRGNSTGSGGDGEGPWDEAAGAGGNAGPEAARPEDGDMAGSSHKPETATTATMPAKDGDMAGSSLLPPGGVPQSVIFWLFVSAIAYVAARQNYLLFHTTAEGFSIVVTMLIYVLATRTYRYSGNNFMLFLGYAYFFIAVIDFGHTLAYKGMGVFPHLDADAPTQLWIAGRYVEALSLFAAPFFMRRRFSRTVVLAGYGLVTGLLLAAILWLRAFPACFVEGAGLTVFKVTSEYIICLILLLAIRHLYLQREGLNELVYKTYTAALVVTVISELCFTLYTDVYGFMNFAGHIFKIVSSYLIFRGVVLGGLNMPFDTIFRGLNDSRKKYRHEHRQLFEIIDFLPDATFVIDREQKVLAWNRAMVEMTGVKKERIVGKGDYIYALPFYGVRRPGLIDFALRGGDPDGSRALDGYDNVYLRGKTIYAENYIPELYKGKGMYLWHIATPLFDSKGNLAGAIETLRDITRRKRIEEKFRNLSTIDGLTGIANRRLFEEHFCREWECAARQAEPLALIICDIDYFKLYNDHYGHLNGDLCLKKVAAVLQRALQRPADLAARYGGEEFAVVLPGTDLPGAAHVAEKLRTAVEALRIEHKASRAGGYLTISLGVAVTIPKPAAEAGEGAGPPLGTDAARLLEMADQALYQAKRKGRNRVESVQY